MRFLLQERIITSAVMRLFVQLQVVLLALQLSTQSNGLQEYCQLETFVATCKPNEVIVMETAYYGRMRLGRCVKGDLGYIGCSQNVLDIADRWCSGRHRCELRIPNEEFERTKPCYQELKSYFEASYSCVAVASLDGNVCKSCESIKLTSILGYIASIISESSGCGTAGCPWIIEAKAGQRINITMLDFTRPFSEDLLLGPGAAAEACAQVTDHIFIKEEARTKSVSICGGTKRMRHIYLSVGNRIELMMSTDLQRDKRGHFLLRHEVLGCPDIKVMSDMWFRRENNGEDAVVGCKSTTQTWHLVCMGLTWLGEQGNCTSNTAITPGESARIAIGGWSVAYGKWTAIIIIVFVAILVGILILLIGLVGWRWYGRMCFRNRRSRRRQKRTPAAPEGVMEKTFTAAEVEEPEREGYETYIAHRKSCPMDIYTHAWEVTRPILERGDVTMLADDMQKAHMLATYCTKDCPSTNTCTFTGCRHNGSDTYATTYIRPPNNTSTTQENTRYFELEPQL